MSALTAIHLFRLELVILLTFAALLLVAPMTTASVFGLPPAGTPFWPRLLGAIVLGLALAVVATDQGWLVMSTPSGPSATGIGLGAFVVLNLTVAFVLATMLIFGADIPTRRGRAALWLLVAAATLLGFVQIAFVRA